jgi:hypothetical protein
VKRRLVLSILTAGLGLASCAKKTQPATVVAKEYIPAHVEGTPREERQIDRERWLVKVEMKNGRKAEADIDAELWKALKVGDRVWADYYEGKYTGTIWSADLHRP